MLKELFCCLFIVAVTRQQKDSVFDQLFSVNSAVVLQDAEFNTTVSENSKMVPGANISLEENDQKGGSLSSNATFEEGHQEGIPTTLTHSDNISIVITPGKNLFLL